MSRLNVAEAVAELRTVRSALLGEAEADAEARLAEARHDVDAMTALARARAKELRDGAEATGRADALRQLRMRRGQAHRHVRTAELAAQRVIYDELRDRIRAELGRLLRAGDLQARLVAHVRGLLGSDAAVTDGPDGVSGVLGSRRVDLSLDALTDRAVDDLGGSVQQLWTA
ncbi:hypothetical protein [Allokutzneria oryzae]|uniref:Uncharacterized protein n=1 Tax=Allokutzneria oryzae TaxID=1378989 RepID=A0ABV6A3P6_9PSEU